MTLQTTQFTPDGLNLGKDTKVLSYMYGLSDFWTYVFEDSSVVNLLLEANALKASDIYSEFLQLCSQISLEDISVASNSQIKLVLIKDSDLVEGSVETYQLSDQIQSSKFIANKPLLPTKTLEENIHFRIDSDTNRISFYKPLSQIGFATRMGSDGAKEYALWFVDSRIDEDLIYNTFGKLINVTAESSSDNFKNLIYGLFYLYANGPNLELIRKGLNLVLGIPLARETETVLDIQTYLNTDQFIVITDLNSYIIPYGLEPTVAIGQTLSISDEIATWVEVKDYINDGDWWLNFMIPASVMPSVPPDTGADRYASPGSYGDYLMRNFLYKHTFLVNVKTINFKNLQTFTQLSEVIKRVKPAYTTPLYVWTVPTADEELNIFEESINIQVVAHRCESVTSGIWRFRRDSNLPLTRGCPEFTRFCAPGWLDKWAGKNTYTNSLPRTTTMGQVEGFISPMSQFRDETDNEYFWEKYYFNRNNPNYRIPKNKVAFTRARTLSADGEGVNGKPDFPGYRTVFLHTTTMYEVKKKFEYFGVEVPDAHSFTFLEPERVFNAINENPINDYALRDYYELIIQNFNYLFSRAADVNLLSLIPKPGYSFYKPSLTDVKQGDFFLFIHVDEYDIGMWWVTTNQTVEGWPYIPQYENDPGTIDVTGPITRGVGHLGSPYFFMRAGGTDVATSSQAYNETAINAALDNSTTLDVKYSDTINSEQVFNRSGKTLKSRIQI